MRKKVDSYLGFAAKSRNLVSGYHTCLHAIKQKKLRLLILSEDLSENTVKKLFKLYQCVFTAVRKDCQRLQGTRKEECSALPM